MLDQVQKGNSKNLSKENVKYLRKHKLVEGRANSLYLSSEVAQTINSKEDYIKNKAFNDQYYLDLIVSYLKQYGKGQKKDFRSLLWSKLPDSLSDDQKENKISNLLTSMKKDGIIRTDGGNKQISSWILVGEETVLNSSDNNQ